MTADIHSRVDSLSKNKKLPKNLDKAKLESAKNGLEEVSKAWDEANHAFKKGSLADAFEKAKGRRRPGSKGRGCTTFDTQRSRFC